MVALMTMHDDQHDHHDNDEHDENERERDKKHDRTKKSVTKKCDKRLAYGFLEICCENLKSRGENLTFLSIQSNTISLLF